MVGALSQKRLVKHAINNETFCLPACLPAVPSDSDYFSLSLLPFSPESSLGVRVRSVAIAVATFLLFLIIPKTTKLEPDLMTHFSRPSLSPFFLRSPDDQTDGGGGSS